jgi:streptogramin lyase
MGRVLVFDLEGNFILGWGGFGMGRSEIGVASGIEVDSVGNIWVSDAKNNRLMQFSPEITPKSNLIP